MNIINIAVTHKEYRDNNGWSKTEDSQYMISGNQILNMQQCTEHFTKMGGKMYWSYKRNRRFGLVPAKVVVISFCGRIKKIFEFNYNYATEI